MNKTLIHTKLAIAMSFVATTQQASACDTCAQSAIIGGFSTIQAAASLLQTNTQALTTSITGLQTTVSAGNTSVANSITALNNSLSTSLTLMNEQVTMAIEGSTVASSLEVARQNAVLKQLSNSYREETKAMIANALKIYAQLNAYNTVGEGSNFIYAGQLDALQDMYYRSELIKESAFSQYMPALSKSTGLDGFAAGSQSLLVSNTQSAWNNKDSLLVSLKYKEVLTEDEFEDLMLITSAYIGDGDDLESVSKKASFFKLVLDKAPIYRISSTELNAVTPFAPEILSHELCSQSHVPAGNFCTSTYALLNALEARVTDSTYLNAINITREKGILQELSRSLSIGNIIKGRTLDVQTSKSLADIFDG